MSHNGTTLNLFAFHCEKTLSTSLGMTVPFPALNVQFQHANEAAVALHLADSAHVAGWVGEASSGQTTWSIMLDVTRSSHCCPGLSGKTTPSLTRVATCHSELLMRSTTFVGNVVQKGHRAWSSTTRTAHRYPRPPILGSHIPLKTKTLSGEMSQDTVRGDILSPGQSAEEDLPASVSVGWPRSPSIPASRSLWQALAAWAASCESSYGWPISADSCLAKLLWVTWVAWKAASADVAVGVLCVSPPICLKKVAGPIASS